ncbi:MAG: hypothetical protein M3Y56_14450 [Armatimonadota bacterium]|nr:hypothetical protein [Armatimonadota bacterium]
MSEGTHVIYGIVQGGVVAPLGGELLPEGVRAAIVILPDGIPGELQAELAAWDAASEEAWMLMDEWETQEEK